MQITMPYSLEYHIASRILKNDALSCRDAGLNSDAVILDRVAYDTSKSF